MDNKIVHEKFELVNKAGNIIRGTVVRPEDTTIQYPAVIFSHGFGANYHELIHHGKGFAENDIICVFFDFCGGGEESTSDGTMLEMTVCTESDDLETVMDWILSISYIDKKSIFLQGESQGGLISAIVGAKRQTEIKGLILWYPAFIIPKEAEERFQNNINEVFGHVVSVPEIISLHK